MSPRSSVPLHRLTWSRVGRLVMSAALLLGAAGCAIITGPDARLADEQRDLSWARRTWTSQYITDYEYVVRRSCYCALGGVAVLVRVENDHVTAREVDGSGVGIPPSLNSSYPTIDGLFARVQDAIDRRAYRVDAAYDTHYGFPTDIWIDYDVHAVDEEDGYTLVRFRALR